MEKETFNFPNKNIGFMFPNSVFIKDFDTQELDTAKHPVIFVVDNYGADNSYGFRATSHPQGSDLESFFFVSLHNGEDFENSEKEDVAIHCDHLTIFGEGFDDKFIEHSFSRRGNIIFEKYDEVMSVVLTKHILLREEKLTTHDPYTEYLLMELDLDKDEIKKSPLYSQLHDELYAKDKPAGIRKVREREIIKQRENIKNIETNKRAI